MTILSALISMFVLGALFMLCINSIIILYYSDQMEDFRVIEKNENEVEN